MSTYLAQGAGLFALLLALAGPLAAPTTAGPATEMKHSGTIVKIDDAARTIVLAEVGPWRVRDGQTVVTYRTIEVPPATKHTLVRREREAASGFAGDFVESMLDRGLGIGDFVTIDCVHEGARLIARSITVMAPEAP